MSLQVTRLHLATMLEEWPVHGFLVTHPGGAVLVDTGVGGPQQVLADHRVVNRSVADALDEHGMTPGDIDLVINTHLHFDHCGQNAVFKHAPFYIQSAELARARRESPQLAGWFDVRDGRFELVDGDGEVLIGDAAYKRRQYLEPDVGDLPPGQASDPAAWRESVGRVHALRPDRVHFCHDTEVIHS